MLSRRCRTNLSLRRTFACGQVRRRLHGDAAHSGAFTPLTFTALALVCATLSSAPSRLRERLGPGTARSSAKTTHRRHTARPTVKARRRTKDANADSCRRSRGPRLSGALVQRSLPPHNGMWRRADPHYVLKRTLAPVPRRHGRVRERYTNRMEELERRPLTLDEYLALEGTSADLLEYRVGLP